MRNVPRRLALVIGLAAAVAMPASVSASHSWGGYHWARTSNPFTLKLGDNLSTNWKPYLGTTSSDWTQSTVLDTSIVPGGSRSPKLCNATTGRVQVCNAKYGNTGWLGVASISITGGTHITQGTVKVNDTYFNTASYNTPAWREFVMCQEVGHTFGLNHQDTTFDNLNLGSCMDYTNDPSGLVGTNGNLANTAPNQHDYDELVTIYTHTDSGTTIGAPAPKGAAAGAVQSEWGREVARTNGGHTSTFVRDLGAGNFMVTFVIWA